MSPLVEPAEANPLRVLVVTVAHRGDDARIAHRQLGALVRAGAEVVLVAPLPDTLDIPPGPGHVERFVIPRANGWRRLAPWASAFRAVRRYGHWADVVLVHDLEAVLPVRAARPRGRVVWDVHEDLVSSVDDRAWIPRPLRRLARRTVAFVERAARSGIPLILAEAAYVERLGPWPVVPNTTVVPEVVPPFDAGREPRVVYVGRLSAARGVRAMIDLGRDLVGEAEVLLIGPVDPDLADELERARAAGDVRWLGPMPNADALRLVDGSLVGLCLLEPLPNYVVSMPSKVYEYLAHGVPVVASPLPLAREAIERSGAGTVVDGDDPSALADAVRRYRSDPERRRREGELGHRWIRDRHDWRRDGEEFVTVLRGWARPAPPNSRSRPASRR